ncbi:MAG: phospho-sugar mutase [Bacteroidales bacterium]|nr:phospho-sugar mutase [Bacteroidales bacterium]MDD4670200.1 phospho-sugar mutase [Bacteroidales bacterium]
MENNYLKVAKSWLSDAFDAQTQKDVFKLMNGDPKELEDSFYRMLEFGTGGLRGIMGVGTNRMNKYTVGMATQGLANYLKKVFAGGECSVVISYDSRNNSREFAKIAADVLLSNEIKVYIFDNIRPTPELSFAIRYLKCKAGIMITASHNPKEYNGYKVFWEDGAQIISPHDKNIIEEVSRITSPEQVNFGHEGMSYAEIIGDEIDKAFLSSVLSLTLSPDSISRHSGLKIVYTPLHGTGVRLVPKALHTIGFTNIYHVEDQDVSDSNFPTVKSPNPEEPTAMKMAMDKAEQVGAEIVLATDPDADRVGVAIRDDHGKLMLLTGNQTASILTYYILTRWQQEGKLNDDTYIVKTIVTTELLSEIAKKFGVEIYNVLTGFKYIAEVVRRNEGKKLFVCGGEESNGFNVGEFVRDKDSIITCSMVAECAAWLADNGKSLYSYLQEIYGEFGYFKEKLLSLTMKGIDGVEQIQGIMKQLRSNPPENIAQEAVVKVIDYNYPDKTGLPKSNVLQFISGDGTIVSVRPSGTEPKIKFYFGAKGDNADEKISLLLEQFGKY